MQAMNRQAWECPRCLRINAPHCDGCECKAVHGYGERFGRACPVADAVGQVSAWERETCAAIDRRADEIMGRAPTTSTATAEVTPLGVLLDGAMVPGTAPDALGPRLPPSEVEHAKRLRALLMHGYSAAGTDPTACAYRRECQHGKAPGKPCPSCPLRMASAP